MTDIVERLRGWQDDEPMKMFCQEALSDLEEAANDIERLRAWAKDEQQKREKVEEDRLVLREENDRLRIALQEIADLPAPVPATFRYFFTRCEHCGWQGSSEQCGEINYGDDADVTCPACRRIFVADEVNR